MDEQADDFPTSKSQRKRDAEALQKLAVSLVDLSDDKLQRLSLPERLHEAILETRRITSHGALRRQHQYLGRLMRQTDVAPIRAALAELAREEDGQTRHFHTLEQWRDRLIARGDDALAELLAEQPTLERAPIRQLIRQARREAAQGAPKRAARALFRHLREQFPPADGSNTNDEPTELASDDTDES